MGCACAHLEAAAEGAPAVRERELTTDSHRREEHRLHETAQQATLLLLCVCQHPISLLITDTTTKTDFDVARPRFPALMAAQIVKCYSMPA